MRFLLKWGMYYYYGRAIAHVLNMSSIIVLLNTIVWLTSCLLEEKIILITRLFVSVDLL